MNVELELSVKLKVTEETPHVEASKPAPCLAVVIDRIASHPAVMLILRRFIDCQ